MYKTVRSARLYEQIVQQIEESILNGALKPGDQLPAERDLAQQFGVSRTAVREAVKALQEKGLVESSRAAERYHRRTTQAIRQSLDLHDPNRAAGRVHPAGGGAGDSGTGNRSPGSARARRAARQHDAGRSAVMDDSGQRSDAFIEADLDFHLALAEAAANPLILSLIDSIVGVLREQRMPHFLCGWRAGTRAVPPQTNSEGGRGSRSGSGSQRHASASEAGSAGLRIPPGKKSSQDRTTSLGDRHDGKSRIHRPRRDGRPDG